MLAFLNLHGCKKEEKAPADSLEGEMVFENNLYGTTFYLQQQTSGAYTGMGSGIGTKSKIKIVKAQNSEACTAS